MRYALYFTPPQNDPLTAAAAAWLGRDAFSGEQLTQPPSGEFSRDHLAQLTADPRRYGFHATLKAPFELAIGKCEGDLLQALSAFCLETPAFDIPEIVVGQLGSFFALVPARLHTPLQDFATRVVEVFEPFRAPLSDADVSRRKPEKLTEPQRRNLDRWGYPYVFDEFRFHMTLTGQVPEEYAAAMRRVLEEHFSAYCERPLPVGGLALFREEHRGAPFAVQSWMPLKGSVH